MSGDVEDGRRVAAVEDGGPCGRALDGGVVRGEREKLGDAVDASEEDARGVHRVGFGNSEWKRRALPEALLVSTRHTMGRLHACVDVDDGPVSLKADERLHRQTRSVEETGWGYRETTRVPKRGGL